MDQGANEVRPVSAIAFERRGAAAFLTLDRGKARNALTPDMVADLTAHYQHLARDPNLYVVILKSSDPKAFCAGGDVVKLSALARQSLDLACEALNSEYTLNWLHECFVKPTVAFLDGVVMGSGAGLSAYATHRVAGPGYRFAMPETAIGFFPDVGMAYVLSRLPHEIGTYLALTGNAIARADAYALGLVTHCLEPAAFAEVEAGLVDAWPVDPLLDERHTDPGPPALFAHAAAIQTSFSAGTVGEIIDRLANVAGASESFAQSVTRDLLARSPFALEVTLKHLRKCHHLDLRQTLIADATLAGNLIARDDFHEGVRAELIDKDHAPRWSPASLADVVATEIEVAFAQSRGRVLNLKLRDES